MAQKFYQKASVQGAIVGAIALILVSLITVAHQRSQLKSDNSQLKHESDLQIAEIQRLETLLAPFRTIALQRYTDPEPEALRKLAHRISELESSVAPRFVSEQQTEALISTLKQIPHGGIYIVSRIMDGEAKDYAEEIGAIMKRAGWDIRYSPMLTDDTIGFGVCSYLAAEKLPGHDTIREVFVRSGIECKDIKIKEKSIPVPDSPSVIIVVGRKM